jgi:hypothetical protein
MNSVFAQVLSLTLLLVCYAVVDALLRQDFWSKLWQRLGLENQQITAALSIVVSLALYFVWRYPPETSVSLRIFGAGIACLLAWNAATRDIDPVVGDSAKLARILVLPAALLAYFNPAFLLLSGLLLSCSLRFWLHHATFPMRLLQALIAGTIASNLAIYLPLGAPGVLKSSFGQEAALLTFLVIIQVSHYLITALAKMLLGPHPFSWVTDNQIHHLAASAYSWGWARFFPWPHWLVVIKTVKRVEIPLQMFAFSLELLSPLAFLSSGTSWVFSCAAASFHGGACAISGLFFWDWIAADLLLAWLVINSPPSVQASAFGLVPLLLGLCVLVIFPLRHKLWKPMPLGWYDTPLAARIHWHVVGESGAEYRVANSFMCPHERLYGRVNGCFFTPYPVVTYHLGEVWKPELRRAILAAGPCMHRLKQVREQFGIWPNSHDYQERHLKYLQTFFCALNQGARKAVLPRSLSWLKAPGDQLFYWGALTAYLRQEPVTEIRLVFVEEYFDGERLIRLHEQEVARVSVPGSMPTDCQPELTPKELDDYLLRQAAGRLIELPGFKKNYTLVFSEL